MAKPFESETDGGTPTPPPEKMYHESLEGSAPSGAPGGESKGGKPFKNYTAPRARPSKKKEPS